MHIFKFNSLGVEITLYHFKTTTEEESEYVENLIFFNNCNPEDLDPLSLLIEAENNDEYNFSTTGETS